MNLQNVKARIRSRSASLPRLSAAGALMLAAAAFGQVGGGGPTWVSLDSSVGPGTPPSATLSPNSTKDQTVLTVSIPGFYVETVVDPDAGTFQRISIPNPSGGMRPLIPASQRGTGRPAVPVINMLVAIPSDAATCTVGSLTPLATTTLTGYRIVPDQPDVMEEEDVDPGIVPPFAFDRTAYASTTPYPSDNGGAMAPVGMIRDIRVQPMSIKPFKFTPGTGQLEVFRTFEVAISHSGGTLPQVREHVLLARQTNHQCCNYDTPAAPWITDHIDYKGAFLFITRSDVIDDFRPLVWQKQERGYTTRVATEADVDTNGDNLMSAEEVRAYIKGWYEDHDESLKYVILVGDTNRIPHIPDPTYGYDTDHYYACYQDGDMYSDMGLGRITFNAGQLPNIVARVLAYEDSPPGNPAFYPKTLLIGHREVEANFCSTLDIASQTQLPPDEPLTYTKVYGINPDGLNSTAYDAMNAGQHIIYYRGHGSPNTFFEWSVTGAHMNDFAMIANYQPQHPSWTPIVISSACANGAFNESDCILEEWFQNPIGGAIAAYGATIGSRRDMNHAFTKVFFHNLRAYGDAFSIDCALTTSQYMALWSTAHPDMTDPDKNLWVYALLGDPEMKVWSKKPANAAPSGFPSQGGAGQAFDITIRNGHGDPIPGAVVSAFKPGEVQKTVYADSNGVARFTVNPLTSGTLTLRTYTYDSRTAGTRIEIPIVICTADVDDGTGSGIPDGGVTIDDLLFYLAVFDAGDIRADVDDGSGSGTTDGGVTIEDLLYFLQRFDRGC